MGKFREDVRDQVAAIRETIVDGWNDARLFVLETWPALILLLLILIVALWWADPAPPRHVLMATGPAGSSNEALGKRYAEYFARQGISLELVSTEGSVENVKRLQDQSDPVMAGFVMSGAAAPHTPGVQTLGSINYQPLWCFYRSSVPLSAQARLAEILGNKVNVGTPESGTYLLTQQVLRLSGLNPDRSNFRQMSDVDAVKALAAGQIASMCIVDTYESPNVQHLLKLEGLQLTDFTRADAYSRVVPAIEKVTVPEGGLDLARNWPDQPMTLIASTTEILIDERLHPAIQTLFLMAAASINGKQNFFSNEGEFPAFKDTSQHRSHEAEIYYEKGSPWLMQLMPFWLAEFIRRLVLILLPFLAVAYPIIKSMPNYHKNRVRGRINRMYGALKFFEQSLVSDYDPVQKAAYLIELDTMEQDAMRMKVPKSVAGDYYTLRSAIDFVRNRVQSDGYGRVQTAQDSVSGRAADWDSGENDDV
jgi:TRAP-type uncharacterized transport system substrate-binding protein